MYWLLENILSLWEVTDYTEEELPNVLRLDLWAGRDFYRALPALTRDLDFSFGIIQSARPSPFCDKPGEKQKYLSTYILLVQISLVPSVWLNSAF